jgi:AcrR family transcriptional regulator
VPTGVHIRDAREQLFDAAERVLLRDGPNALTSRAVTTEAGCAKGVLHRHFADFDAFLAELVLDRIARLDTQSAGLRESAGSGTVAGNLAEALTTVFSSVAVAIVALITFRDDLRARLRRARSSVGVPLATEADIDTLAPTLIGAGHLLFADRGSTRPDAEAVHKMVTTVIAGAVRERSP